MKGAPVWVRFIRDFDWYPPEKKGRIHIAYKSGMVTLVRRKCGEDAIAAGVATLSERKENHGNHKHRLFAQHQGLCEKGQ